MPTIPAVLHDCHPFARAEIIRALPDPHIRKLDVHFPEWAHAGQRCPEGDWRTWVMMAGRGFGKTRAGAEWVLGLVRGKAPPLQEFGPACPPDKPRRAKLGWGGECRRVVSIASEQHNRPHPNPSPEGEGLKGLRIALIAATIEEARAIMVEGASGILACAGPDEIADWAPARRTLTFASGAQAFLYSGASPESLRGPEHDFAWCDELAKWAKPDAAWDNLQLGLRRGAHPRALVTTTPRAGTALRRILDAAGTVVTGGPTSANPHLPPAFLRAVEGAYAGTRLGRQELDGELLGDVEGSLWPGVLVEGCRVSPHPAHALRESPSPPEGEGGLVRVVIGVDPPASAAGTCGIVVCGLDGAGLGFVLADASVSDVSPEGWARAVAAAAERWDADRIVVEGNQGGNMVESVLRGACATLPIRIVHAKAGKAARAEPVAALFESGRAWFAGRFPALEAQLAGLVAGGGYVGPGASPDRADAMVWALWALMLGPVRAEPQVRSL